MSRILQSLEGYGKAVSALDTVAGQDSTGSDYLELRQECWELARAIAVSKQQVEQEGDREERDTTMLRLVTSVSKAEDAALKEQILLILPPEERPKFSTLLEEHSIYKGNIERIAKEKGEQ